MLNQTAEIAALKLLMIGLYAHVAGKEGTSEKAQAFIDGMKSLISRQIEDSLSRNSDKNTVLLSETQAIVNDFLNSMNFLTDKSR